MNRKTLNELQYKDVIVEFAGFMFVGHITEFSEIKEKEGIKYREITFRSVVTDEDLEEENGTTKLQVD